MVCPSIRSTVPIEVARRDPTSADDAARTSRAATRVRARAVAPQTSPNTARRRQHVMSSQSAAPDKTTAARSAPGESTVRPLRTAKDPRGLGSRSAALEDGRGASPT